MGADADLTEGLRASLRELERKERKSHWLNPHQVAKGGSLLKAYVFYAELCADSAHPSLEALDRHINRSEDGTLVNEQGFCVDPRFRPAEAAETMKSASLAVLCAYVSINDLLGGGTSVDKDFPVLFNEFNALTGDTE